MNKHTRVPPQQPNIDLDFSSFYTENRIYVYGTSNSIQRLHSEIKLNYPFGIVKEFIEKELKIVPNRAYYYWLKGKKPAPVSKLSLLVKRWSTICGENGRYPDVLSHILESSRGFSAGSGSRRKIVNLPAKLSPKLAYLVGYLYADGWISSNQWAISAVDGSSKYITHVLATIFRQIFNTEPAIVEETNKTTMHVYSKPICLYFHRIFGMPIGEKKGKLSVPDVVLQSPIEIKKWFTIGFMDGDAGIPHLERYKRVPRWIIKSPIIEISQSSHQILVDVKNILGELGLKTSGPYLNPINKGHRLMITSKSAIAKSYKILTFLHPLKRFRHKLLVKAMFSKNRAAVAQSVG